MTAGHHETDQGLLVFGKTGQVSQELQRLTPVTNLDRNDGPLSDPAACRAKILRMRPSAVINAAAYTAVDRAEDEEDLATLVNGEAPGAMALACAELGIPFLHISTDYVFDGGGNQPWRESDAVAPLNAYGRSKLAGERAVLTAGGNSAILRTSWVFSAQGANFVTSMLSLSKSGNELNIVADQVGGPTPATAIAETLLTMATAMRNGQSGGLYHFAGAPWASWADFAREIFTQNGSNITVYDIPSEGYPTPAKRPLNSRLDCSKIQRDFGIAPPDWKAGLSRVLKELKETDA